MGEGMRIGTDIDILLSSFKATDANHDTRGNRNKAWAKCVPFAGLLRQTVMGSQARGAPGPEMRRGRGSLCPHHPGGQLCFL